MTGTNIPKTVDGKSLLPVIRGRQREVRDRVFLAYRDVQRSVRIADWHLIRYPHINKSQLFDLKNDPHEMKNLAGRKEQEAKERELMTALEGLQRELGDTLQLTSPMPREEAWTPEKARIPGKEKGK